jgi:hypothetical protein
MHAPSFKSPKWPHEAETRAVHLMTPEPPAEVVAALSGWLDRLMGVPGETAHLLSPAAVSDLRITIARARRCVKQLGGL